MGAFPKLAFVATQLRAMWVHRCVLRESEFRLGALPQYLAKFCLLEILLETIDCVSLAFGAHGAHSYTFECICLVFGRKPGAHMNPVAPGAVVNM